MLSLKRLQGQSLVIETPTGAFHILVKEINQEADRITLTMNAEWMPGHVDATLQVGSSIAPRAFAGLASIHFLRWNRKGDGRVALGIDAPRDWNIYREESPRSESSS